MDVATLPQRAMQKLDFDTVPKLLQYALETHRKKDAFLIKRGGVWTPVSMESVMGRVAALVAVLRGRGVKHGDRVSILAETSLEWAIADMAILTIGAVTVPVYPTLPGPQVAPLLVDSGATGIFVSTKPQREKIESVRSEIPNVRWVWCFEEEPLPDGVASGGVAGGGGTGGGGTGGDPEPGPDDLATIIYTSGTTGIPKGVMLTQSNFVAQARISLAAMNVRTTDVYLSFLPLSHVFERISGLYTMLCAGATIAYAESIDRMPSNIPEVRPTILLAVPRFWEKLMARAVDANKAAGFPKAQIFQWAYGVAVRVAELRNTGRSIPPWLSLQHALANRLVYSKIAQRLGGRVRLRVSGSAALNREVALFFDGAGQPIFEGYGLSETASAATVNRFESHRVGTVGPPLDGVEIRLAEDGEILLRGPNVMKGYWNRPEETRETLDSGWLRTGDIGVLDPDGHLRITDRKKDLIVTSGGKKIPPQMIEGALKSSPKIHEAVVVGDGRKFIGALIIPEGAATQAEIAAEVERINGALAQFEKIKRFEMIPNDLSVENGTLTPSLKVKRKVMAERYRDTIERMFQGA
ncbi:MAG TPA: long-chain fatty acid--CoA ligase [Candidatus Eisenbacteria bacterium]|nr:long-chain fatty acid--CoA ligase [Candidatus Eisenbacteria bacterium]